MKIVPDSILVFSIATNGYERHFADFLRKQEEFSRAIGADYWVARGAPPWGISAHDSAWLKIPLLHAGLCRGYEWVIYLDADCEVRTRVSPLIAVAGHSEGIFACHDFSGRINSGVMIVRNVASARRLLRRVWLSAFLPAKLLPAQDRNSYENGHVIHFLKGHPAVRIIDERWNWTRGDNPIEAYVHHFGGWTARPVASPRRSRWPKLSLLFTGFRLPLHLRYFRRDLPSPRGPAKAQPSPSS